MWYQVCGVLLCKTVNSIDACSVFVLRKTVKINPSILMPRA